MAKTKRCTPEIVVAGLLENKTMRETAEAIGVSETTVYSTVNTDEFRQLYKQAMTQLLDLAVANCQSRLSKAFQVVEDIMLDESLNAQTRLFACQTIIKHSVELYNRVDGIKQAEFTNNIFGLW